MIAKSTRSQITLDQLTEVKHELLIADKLVSVGFSVDSLKKNQYLYEVHETHSGKKCSSGRINIFGVTFLSGFVRYRANTFINLISASGRKVIELHDFEHGVRSQLVRSIDYKDFQLKPARERYGLYYLNDTILLVELTETPPLTNVLIRTWEGDALGPTYRIISFDPLPKIFFSPSGLWLLNQAECTHLSLKCQPQHYEINNWESIKVVAVHEQFIVTFGDSTDYFCMHKTGRVVDLAQNVRAIATHQHYLGLIVQPTEFDKKFLLLEYDSSTERYQQTVELSIPVESKNSLMFGEWIKVDIESNQNYSKRQFLRIDLEVSNQRSHHRKTGLGLGRENSFL